MGLVEQTGADARTMPQVCACGQDLDGVERPHCPRCGCQLHGGGAAHR